MKGSEILRAARAKIASPKTWCRGRFQMVRTEGGKQYIAYCSIGALHAAHAELGLTKGEERRGLNEAGAALREIAGISIESYNDRSTHSGVVAMWDRAIALAEERERWAAPPPPAAAEPVPAEPEEEAEEEEETVEVETRELVSV